MKFISYNQIRKYDSYLLYDNLSSNKIIRSKLKLNPFISSPNSKYRYDEKETNMKKMQGTNQFKSRKRYERRILPPLPFARKKVLERGKS